MRGLVGVIPFVDVQQALTMIELKRSFGEKPANQWELIRLLIRPSCTLACPFSAAPTVVAIVGLYYWISTIAPHALLD
jgi:hypothetical protein